MKRTTQFVAAALVAVLTLSGLSVLAAEEQAAPAKRAGHPFAAGSGTHHKAQFRGRGSAGQGWSRKELTQEEKTARLEARKATLAAWLEAGKITQEQYDEQLAKIEAGDFGFRFNGRNFKGEKPEMNREGKPEGDRKPNFSGFQRGWGKGMGHRMHKGAPAENTAEN